MEFEYIKDYAMFTAIFGILSFIWFMWAQERPLKPWRKYIWVGAGLALAVGLVGIFLTVTNWNETSALNEFGPLSMYLTVLTILIIIGVVVSIFLSRNKKQDLIAPWLTFVFAAQFNWLVRVFIDFSLYILGFLIVVVALFAPHFARKYGVASSAITGIGAGTLLLLFALFNLIRFLLV